MTKAHILAVDPGKTGALAFLSDCGQIVHVYDMPVIGSGKGAEVSGSLLAHIIETHSPERAIVEQVGAMPGQGVSSMFRFGESYGVAKGVIAGCNVPLELVTPAKWMREMGLSGKDKETHRQKAIQLFPADCEYFKRKKDHGRAEACLLALWWLSRAGQLQGDAA